MVHTHHAILLLLFRMIIIYGETAISIYYINIIIYVIMFYRGSSIKRVNKYISKLFFSFLFDFIKCKNFDLFKNFFFYIRL